MTVSQSWYGCNIQFAMRTNEQETVDRIMLLFARMLHRMNEDHPWVTEYDSMEEVREMIDFDPTWTLEDFALSMAMMAKGELARHNGRPSTGWIRKCQIAYSKLKSEAREEIARRAKVKAEADAMEAAYTAGLSLPTSESHIEQPRTMAEFLGGKNRLSFAEREAMKQRQKEQSNG